MIIAAFAGVGKTYFCNTVPESKDLVSMPFKYCLPNISTSTYSLQDEQLKANFDLQRNWDYPENYLSSIRDNISKYTYVVIPSDYQVLDGLRKEKIPYILCYPVKTAKSEYEQRYLKRGNSQSFLDVFIRNWDQFMKSLVNDTYGIHLIVQEKEYLTDKLQEIKKISSGCL